jgi:DNA polymerase III epsilon subunit-like protein
VCRCSTEPGGPRRCSSDARTALQHSIAEVAACQAAAAAAADELEWRPTGPGSAEDLNLAYRRNIKLSPVLAAVQFARAVLQPGRAVIVDTETADMGGPICEIAVIDAHDGRVLMNTLVNPGVPIDPGAQAVHGISAAQVSAADVPTWPMLYRQFEQLTAGRVMLAYYADYDRSVITNDTARHGITGAHVSTHRLRWADVMMPRTHYAQAPRWLKNGGGHRALGDVEVTRAHLVEMATGAALQTAQPRPPTTRAQLDAALRAVLSSQ